MEQDDAIQHAKRLLTSPCGEGKWLRSQVRQVAEATKYPTCQIDVAEDTAAQCPPTRLGEPAHYTFKRGGGLCKAPGAALKAGHRLLYHPTTVRIVVGAEWLGMFVMDRLIQTWPSGTLTGRPGRKPKGVKRGSKAGGPEADGLAGQAGEGGGRLRGDLRQDGEDVPQAGETQDAAEAGADPHPAAPAREAGE